MKHRGKTAMGLRNPHRLPSAYGKKRQVLQSFLHENYNGILAQQRIRENKNVYRDLYHPCNMMYLHKNQHLLCAVQKHQEIVTKGKGKTKGLSSLH